MDRIKVMVNGIPGNMAVNVARRILDQDGFELVLQSLTGPEITQTQYPLDAVLIDLIHPDSRSKILEDIKQNEGFFLSVDYTHPSAVTANAKFYCHYNLPFVMGTTGGDRAVLEETVRASSISAVIAPNMAKQIVGFQAMMEYAKDSFPGLFNGYSLEIKESHQQGKADTSGTAKAMVGYFNKLGIPFSSDEIEKTREPEIQEKGWGIPKAYLTGHGWHTYNLVSKDTTVKFAFCHNVNGRQVYVDGTLDALEYLQEKVAAGTRGTVFSMIDVLKGK